MIQRVIEQFVLPEDGTTNGVCIKCYRHVESVIKLENHNVTGLLTISQDIENIMNVYTCVCMNIFVLLYADDTVLMAETP
jgi:hypothetical protein